MIADDAIVNFRIGFPGYRPANRRDSRAESLAGNRLTFNELRTNWSQIATSSKKYRGPKRLPLAFAEHGAIMAATILNSPRAVEMSVYVVRAFVKLRELLASNTKLARKLEALEKSVASLDATLGASRLESMI